ncbi:MAG: hypothetical protein IPL43_14950 [Micropruina sp.]|nr:hypothetical protein [Micropruina sp.]
MREFSTNELDAVILDRDDLAAFMSGGTVDDRCIRIRLTILALPGPRLSLQDFLVAATEDYAGDIRISAVDGLGPVALEIVGGRGGGSDELIRQETDLRLPGQPARR